MVTFTSVMSWPPSVALTTTEGRLFSTSRSHPVQSRRTIPGQTSREQTAKFSRARRYCPSSRRVWPTSEAFTQVDSSSAWAEPAPANEATETSAPAIAIAEARRRLMARGTPSCTFCGPGRPRCTADRSRRRSRLSCRCGGSGGAPVRFVLGAAGDGASLVDGAVGVAATLSAGAGAASASIDAPLAALATLPRGADGPRADRRRAARRRGLAHAARPTERQQHDQRRRQRDDRRSQDHHGQARRPPARVPLAPPVARDGDARYLRDAVVEPEVRRP